MNPDLIVNYSCKLGEGPLWHPDEHALYWTDIENGRLYRYLPMTGHSEICFEGDLVGGMTLQEDGSLLLFMNRGGIRHWINGELRDVHTDIPDELNTRFNDVIADPHGRVLCGLLAPSDRSGRLYRLDTDGTLTVLLQDIGCSNGFAFANNNAQIYYTDSLRAIYRFDYDVETGTLNNRQTFWTSPLEGVLPDGMTVDEEGCVWTAQWSGGCVIRLNPDGSESGRILVPGAKYITSAAFGGDDLCDLYITTAAQDDTGENAGALFVVRPGVRGVPEYRSNIESSTGDFIPRRKITLAGHPSQRNV